MGQAIRTAVAVALGDEALEPQNLHLPEAFERGMSLDDDFQASTASRDAAALASAYGYALSAAFGVACMPHMR